MNKFLLIKNYSLPNTTVLSKLFLNAYIKMFWNDVFKILYIKNPNIHIKLLTKIRFDNGDYRTLTVVKTLNYDDMDQYIDHLCERITTLVEAYFVNPIDEISLTYIILKGKGLNTIEALADKPHQNAVHNFNKLVLPVTMQPEEYVAILATQEFPGVTRYVVETNDKVFTIDVKQQGEINQVQVRGPAEIRYTDTKLSDTLFKRELQGGATIYFNDKTPIVNERILPAKPFNKTQIEKSKILTSKFMTIDIESLLIEGIQKPYLICGYTTGKAIHSFAQDISAESISNMFKDFVNQLISLKEIKYVYAHNLSGFDGILMFKHLLDIPGIEVTLLMYNGKLISFKLILKTVNRNGKIVKRIMIFKDSLLLLPISLRKLCDTFSDQ